MAKLPVTGDTGFIGYHVADLLIDYGLEVVILDDLCTDRASSINPDCREKEQAV
jgi:UDP-glucose 4-epimerase